MREILERSPADSYIKNINYFENKLIENAVSYFKTPKSNTFVFPKPADNICKYYQLSTFKGLDGDSLSHVMIFPYHREEDMDKLIKDIAADQKATHKLLL